MAEEYDRRLNRARYVLEDEQKKSIGSSFPQKKEKNWTSDKRTKKNIIGFLKIIIIIFEKTKNQMNK